MTDLVRLSAKNDIDTIMSDIDNILIDIDIISWFNGLPFSVQHGTKTVRGKQNATRTQD